MNEIQGGNALFVTYASFGLYMYYIFEAITSPEYNSTHRHTHIYVLILMYYYAAADYDIDSTVIIQFPMKYC